MGEGPGNLNYNTFPYKQMTLDRNLGPVSNLLSCKKEIFTPNTQHIFEIKINKTADVKSPGR